LIYLKIKLYLSFFQTWAGVCRAPLAAPHGDCVGASSGKPTTLAVGAVTLSKLFAGPAGMQMLLLFVLGSLGLSFPWPGPGSVKFVASLVTTLANSLNKKLPFFNKK